MVTDEWTECRATIGRMDTVLEDLRKHGFSLVTGLLTASGLVGGLANNKQVLPVASLAIMVLVVGLYGIDLYYQVVMTGAAERALDLEFDSSPPLRLTKRVTDQVIATHTDLAVFVLYLFFLATTVGLGLLGSDTILSRSIEGGVGGGLAFVVLVAWLLVRRWTHLHRWRDRGSAWNPP